MEPRSFEARRDLLPLVAGPASLGLCVGLRHGLGAALVFAVAMPAIWLGVAALTVPALYVGAAVAGVAPPAVRVAPAVGAGLRDAGVALLGVAPAALFLVATSADPATVHAIACGVAGLGAGLGLWRVARRMLGQVSEEGVGRAVALGAGWAVVCVGIGGHLFAALLQRYGAPDGLV